MVGPNETVAATSRTDGACSRHASGAGGHAEAEQGDAVHPVASGGDGGVMWSRPRARGEAGGESLARLTHCQCGHRQITPRSGNVWFPARRSH
jgi:hypothetical protein